MAQALSDFAEYVEKQQALRFPSSAPLRVPKAPDANAGEAQNHADLDDILDSLDLSEPAPRVLMRELLLSADGSLQKLADLISERLSEGHGETIFDLGFESHGDSMGLSKPEWDTALDRLARAAKLVHADCQVLLTRNVGGEVEVEAKGKEKDCTGKVLIRQQPGTVEEVIETRIAVVGNGTRVRRRSAVAPLVVAAC